MQCNITAYIPPAAPGGPAIERYEKMSNVQKYGEEFQRVSKDGFDAAVSLVK